MTSASNAPAKITYDVPAHIMEQVEQNNRILTGMMAVIENAGQRYLTCEQAAKYIGVAYSTFMKIKHRIPKHNPTADDKFDVHDLVEYMRTTRTEGRKSKI